MIEETIIKTLEHAPELLAILVVVWLFLKSIGKQQDEIRELHAESEEARTHSRDVIEKNTAELVRLTDAHNALTDATKEMTNVLRQLLTQPRP